MDLEENIKASLPTEPRLTPEYIDSCVVSETFTRMPSQKVLVCELTLRNGFTVRGEAAVVSLANYRQNIGEQISRENALNKVWELEGYLLQQRLHEKLINDVNNLRKDIEKEIQDQS